MKYQIPSHINIAQDKGAWIVLDSRKNRFYIMNETAATFLQHLKHCQDTKKAIQQLSQTYHVSCEQIEKDMERLLQNLLQKGLLIEL